MRRIPSVTPVLALPSGTLAPPHTAPIPGPQMPRLSRYETFRVVHHKHILPGPRVLLPGRYRGITGDMHAMTRNLGALSLVFTKAALAVSAPFTQVLIGCGVGVAWGFGLRQTIHSTILATRTLRSLREETRVIAQTPATEADTNDRAAMLGTRRTARAEAQVRRVFGGLVGSVATAGAGLGWLLRAIAVGGHTAALAQVATPMLSVFFPVLGLSNAGWAAHEAWAFGKTFSAARRAKRAVWPRLLGHEPQVRRLLHARHVEQRWCRAGNAITHAVVAVGAPLTFFLGPLGLAVLVPGVIGNLATDVADQRIIHYPNQLSIDQQLRLGHEAALGAAIVRAEARYRMLHRLRRERHMQYPRGLGISTVRPFARAVLALRRWLYPQRMARAYATEPTLARIADAQHAIDQQHANHMKRLRALGVRTAFAPSFTPAVRNFALWHQNGRQSLPALYALLVGARVCEPFAKAVLESRPTLIRIAALGAPHLMRLRRRSLRLDVRALLMQSPAVDDRKLTQRLLKHGEATLLVEGKNTAMFERRQLLDMLDAQIKARAAAAR